MNTPLLDKSVKILLLVLLVFVLLYYGKPFLVPFLIASLLAMLILPLCVRLEKKMHKAVATLLTVALLLIIVSIIVAVISWQVSDLSDKAPQIQQNITQKVAQLKKFVTNTLGIPEQQQQQIMQQQQQSSTGQASSMLSGFFSSFGSFLTNFIVVMVYIFLFLLFRTQFQKFILQLSPQKDQQNAQEIMHDVRLVAQKYLTGLAIMIIGLWIMYSIGFSIAGVDNAIFFAILCGLLEIVPFVGNLVGVSFTLLMSLAQGAESSMLIGIVVTYGIVQFVQTYVLEPMVVGREISINPVFTIVGLVGGELLWGIAGMILALPLLGIIKIVCDHIEPLKPFGLLIGDNKKGKSTLVDKIKKKLPI
ncbi:MAG TPA: AI-2E family transporter [Flavisolibacter sp.]|jgi:predicted PurR-regulated permease PerM|nr:AI-2E family transporter [Flavisolibacter sp.]